MSRWETLSYKEGKKTDSITRFVSGTKSQTEEIYVSGGSVRFDGERAYLSHDVTDGYMLRVSDTSDQGTIRRLWTNEQYTVYKHNESLWTADLHQGPSWDWHEDKLAQLPDWVQVGGNWEWMDES